MSGDPANVLVIGRGGREHALAWALARAPTVRRVWVAPGNGGTALKGGMVANVDLQEDDFAGLIAFAGKESVGLVVVGPEAPLALGITDAFKAAGIACFGPSKAAARLESSKAFAKTFMTRHGIPTARYAVFRELSPALDHLHKVDYPVVIKASGLAAGKGVVLPETIKDAETILTRMLEEHLFGVASDEVVIEERLLGPEASVLAFCDGRNYRLMPIAQDHKRVFDGDKGPNTGGMGAYAPAPIVTRQLLAAIEETVFAPALRGMAAEGAPFAGVLYAGLMLTKTGPQVIEFNCRFGDPETQVILPLLRSDIANAMRACISRTLGTVDIDWSSQTAVSVVAASGGYPGAYSKGQTISGIDAAAALPGTLVYHAGTRLEADRRLVTDGGRVLSITGTGDTFAQARARAYASIEKISFEGMHYRRDIGAKAQ